MMWTAHFVHLRVVYACYGRTMQPGYSMYSLSRSGQFFRFSSTFSLRVMKEASASTVRSC